MSRPGRYSFYGRRQNRITRSFEPKIVASAGTAYTDAATVTLRIAPIEVVLASETFGTTVSMGSGWGTDSQGDAWSTFLATGADVTKYGKGSGSGQIKYDTANSNRNAFVGPAVLDSDQRVMVTLASTPTGTGGLIHSLASRATDTLNLYRGRIQQLTGSGFSCNIARVVAGTNTDALGTNQGVTGLVSGDNVWLRMVTSGGVTPTLDLYIWKDGTTEPTTPTLSWTDPSPITNAGQGGIRGIAIAGNTSLPTISYANYISASLAEVYGQSASAVYTDTETPVVAITPSTVDLHEIQDAGTVPIALTPSSTDLKVTDYLDSGTPVIAITPSVVDIHEIPDVATVALAITPSATEFAGQTNADTATVGVVITPIVGAGAITPAYHDSTNSVLGARATSINVNIPGSASIGDLALLFCDSNASGVTWTTPSGWTVVPGTPANSSFGNSLAAFYRVLDGTEGTSVTLSITGGTTRSLAASIVAYSGINPTTPILDTPTTFGSSSGTTTASFPSVTLSAANEIVVTAVGWSGSNGAGSSVTPPTGYTERQDVSTAIAAVAEGLIEVSDKLFVASGTTGAFTATVANSGAVAAIAVPLNPATGVVGEAAQFADTGTVAVGITPSSTEFITHTYTDAATPVLAVTPSTVDIHEIPDSGTVSLVITPEFDAGTGIILTDNFNRTTGSDLGTASDGHVWVRFSGTAANNLVVTDHAEFRQPSGTNTNAVYYITAPNGDSRSVITNIPSVLTSQVAGQNLTFCWRYRSNVVGASENGYECRLSMTASGGLRLTLVRYAAGAATTLVSSADILGPGTWTLADQLMWEVQVIGDMHELRLWKASGVRPNAPSTLWDASADGTKYPTGIGFAFRIAANGTPAADETWNVDNVSVVDLSEVAQFADAATIGLAITPSGVDTYSAGNTYTDANTVSIVLTPSVVEAAQFGDSATVLVDIDNTASLEQRVSTDSATVPVAFTPFATEGAQFADSANVPVLLTPIAVEAALFADAVSVGVALTPASTDTAQYLESATIPIALTPSAAEVYGRVLTDTGAVALTLSPSAQESAQRADASTVPVTITNSGSEFVIAGLFDADTSYVHVTPSIVEIADLVDSANVPLNLSVTFTEVPERAFLDSNTVSVAITPITTFEDLFKTDVAEVLVKITPFTLSEFQSDGDIVPMHISAALAEIFVHDDSNVVILNIDGSSLEVTSLTTMGTVLFTVTPSVVTVFEGIDQATILVTITPGVVFEVQQVADYLLVGVISNKWTAILRDATYSGTLHDTRYVVVGFDNRWSYHYRGRGDE